MATAKIITNSRIRYEGAVGTNGAYTVLFWVRPTNVAGAAAKRLMLLNQAGNAVGRFQMSATVVGTLIGTAYIGVTAQSLTVASVLSDNVTSLIGLSWSGTNGTLKMWKNGIEIATGNFTGATPADTGVHIGESTTLIEGEYGDVRVYNRALSAAEHENIYARRGTDSINNGLLLRWAFFDAAPTTTITTNMIKDISGNDKLANAIVGSPVIGDELIGLGFRRRTNI